MRELCKSDAKVGNCFTTTRCYVRPHLCVNSLYHRFFILKKVHCLNLLYYHLINVLRLEILRITVLFLMIGYAKKQFVYNIITKRQYITSFAFIFHRVLV
jgi:hypothetical protein